MKNIFLLAIAAFALAACNSPKDGNGNGNDGGDGNANSENYTYSVTYSGGESGYDNLLFFDLMVSYKGADGKMVEVPVTEYPFNATITVTEMPFTAEITPVYTLKDKEDIDSSKELYRICNNKMRISYIRSDKQSASTDAGHSTMTLPFDKAYERIKQEVERLNGQTISLEVK